MIGADALKWLPQMRLDPHTLSAQVTAFAGCACLAAAVAIAALTPLVPANAAPGKEQAAANASLDFNKKNGTLYIEWSGPIVAGMADYLSTELGKYGTVSRLAALAFERFHDTSPSIARR